MGKGIGRGERLDDLLIQDMKIWQKEKGFRFGEDAVLLAWFVTVEEGDKVMDLGTGSGVIPLLLTARAPYLQVVGLEIQEEMADMARRSVALNHREDCITIHQGDLRQASQRYGEGTLDLVVSNPPYLPLGRGDLNPSSEVAIARHEICCKLEEVIREGSKLLRPRGRLALIHRPERLTDLLTFMRQQGVEPTRLRLVLPSPGREAKWVLVEGIKGGKTNLKVLAPLVVREADGSFTPEAGSYYGLATPGETEEDQPPIPGEGAAGKGCLYLVATPIGNLEDITLRALRILGEAQVIAAEDTRQTRKLLTHFEIHTPLISYHEHNKGIRGPELIRRMEGGATVALVSDAGMPGISDPGTDLVALAVAAGIPVVPIPGPSAGLTALVVSGLPTDCFTFVGFLPRGPKERRRRLESLREEKGTLIFYEAPHRLTGALEDLHKILGDRQGAAARELTKRFEEVIRGPLSQLQQHFTAHPPRGEFVLVVEGATDAPAGNQDQETGPGPEGTIVEQVQTLINQGMDKKEAMRQVARLRKLSRREVYQTLLRDHSAEAEKSPG